MAVEEIYESVDSQCHLTFDYLLFCFVAAMISGVSVVISARFVVEWCRDLQHYVSCVILYFTRRWLDSR